MTRLFVNADILAWKDDGFITIKNGYLGVDGDTICYVGETAPAEKYDEVRDYSGRVLMPGLINCHCHAPMVLLRGIGSDLPLDRWLFEKMIPIEDRLTREEIAAGNELAMMEMIACGTTSYSDMYMQPDTAIKSNETIGMKMNQTRVLQSFDPNEDPKNNFRIDESIAFFKKYHGVQNGRVRFDYSIHAEYTTNDRATRAYVERIRPDMDKDVMLQLHLAETEKETVECIQRHGMTPVAWCEAMGLFDFPTYAGHCVWVNDDDLKIMKNRGVSVVHNPTSNMKLGSGYAPVPKMVEMGINVALGTDGAASNNNLNMFEEMHLAAVLHNGYHRDPTIMGPDTVLRMATVNGARAQGRSDTGTIEVGKKADIIAVDFRNKAHMYPAFDIKTMLVYSAQGSDVSLTMVDGKILYEDGKFFTLDPQRVLRNARAAVKELYREEA
ncbi:MAG: amidohydrolase [Clostridiales bacterium]|nr:amidohydrolase [Clostridiales bacterium]